MKASTRRAALWAIGGFGVSASVGLRSSVVLATEAVACPLSPMRLSRRIDRGLRGGAILRVDRSWQVQFRVTGGGISIVGEQIEATVSAPQSLSAIAEIERTRSTADMWPIRLSDDGRILSTGNGTREEDLAAAIAQAEQIISSRPIPVSEREAQLQYLADLQRAGASLLARLPDDLFFPRLGPIRSVRSVDLPGGLTGQFEVTYDAQPSAEGEWLHHAEREVITRLGGNEQRALEVWDLRPF